MFLMQLIIMALRGLQANLMRSVLAMTGVIIGVGAVVAAMSILAGAEKDIMEDVASMGADQIMIASGNPRRSGRQVNRPVLTPQDAQAIRDECSLIKEATAEIIRTAQIKHLQRNKPVQIQATTAAYSRIHDYHVAEGRGRFITREDNRAERKVCVLGSDVADELFGAIPAKGARVKINGHGFTVVGVMEEKGSLGFRNVDSFVFVPLNTGMRRLFGTRYVDMITAQAVDPDELDAAKLQIARTLRGQHKIRAGDEDDFIMFTQEQIKEHVSDFGKIFQVVLYSIAGISLVVGGIGIMNIMLVSVTERTREIGVRIAVGARRIDIMTQFMIEAAV
ncbi:MAG: ABC transporter permease, partial [Planctomycetes bacterium]|nr:ABC transporter permease [Planctomycetota bacterium]